MPGEGFEPPAFGLQNRCTTAVLTRPRIRASLCHAHISTAAEAPQTPLRPRFPCVTESTQPAFPASFASVSMPSIRRLARSTSVSHGTLRMDVFAPDFSDARQRMIDGQLRPNKVTDQRILDAMGTLPREDF